MDLNAVRIFIKVAETLNFTQAASALNLTQSGASRAITRLEASLGMRLLNRNTHGVSLTSDGEFLYQRAKPLVHEMLQLASQLSGRQTMPEGNFRITTPSAFGSIIMLPLIENMLSKHPKLVIDAVMTDRFIDIIDEGFDAAVRIGKIQDSRLIARHVKDLHLVVVAAPDYFRRRPVPQSPADLRDHNCLAVINPHTGGKMPWEFLHQGKSLSVAVNGNMTFDLADRLLDAARRGMGIVQLMDFAVDDSMMRGELISVLDDYAGVTRPLSVVYPTSRHRSPKISALLTALGLPR
ncbi:LysR family transcriptional regulator [Brenneria sp. 4F2]|nr:LysR family transcriptional regulator [Brenneria bubanii]